MNALLRAAGLSASIVALGLLTSGCKDDKTVTADDAGAADAGPKPVLDGKLGAAVAAAESSSRQPNAAAPGDGPPEAGFFPPGGADKAQPAGAPAKVEVLSDGAEPRVAMVTAPPGEQQARVLAGYRVAGQQGNLPPFDFTLAIKAEKPKSKDDKPEPAQVVAKVVAVQIPGLGGKLPKELTDGLDKLKGGEIRYKLTPEGAMLDLTTSMSKDKDKAPPEIAPLLDLAMRGLVEAVTLSTVPLPKKPVGVGGYWIATDRGTSFGIDVVRYRVFKVQKIDKDQVTLSVDTRQYAVSADIDLGAIVQNQKITADHFDSQGKGTITWVANQTVPTSSETSQRTTVTIGGGPKGQPKGGLQVELQTKTGEAEKADKKK